jgi:DeoR family transcriptional regulator, fructose operon transcriptional repressor
LLKIIEGVKRMSDSRRDGIKKFIYEKGDVQFKELEQLFPEVSSMTIRRDLAFLEEEGDIMRTWGGAKAVNRSTRISEDIFSLRATENIHNKTVIAQKTLEFVETGRSIFIDAGTTSMCLAKILPNQNFSILTTAPNIAMEIIKNSNPSVTLVGGQLNRSNLTTSGANSINFIKNINIDIAFMATSGFSEKNGFTVGNFDECELKKAIIKKAGKIILMMDESKIDRNMPYTFAVMKDIDMLVCNTKPTESVVKFAEKQGVKLV